MMRVSNHERDDQLEEGESRLGSLHSQPAAKSTRHAHAGPQSVSLPHRSTNLCFALCVELMWS